MALNKQQLVELSEKQSDDLIEEVITYLAENNRKEYNIGKVNEELFEIGEAFNKYLNKHPDYKPDPLDIFKEVGDLLFRLTIWSEQEFGKEQSYKYIDQGMIDHPELKAKRFVQHIIKGKYEGGV